MYLTPRSVSERFTCFRSADGAAFFGFEAARVVRRLVLEAMRVSLRMFQKVRTRVAIRERCGGCARAPGPDNSGPGSPGSDRCGQ
jgi:hypothetical protein